MSYLLWKLLHIVGVVMFLGNITTGLFWAAYAHRRREFSLIASTFRGIIQSDRWLTGPGVLVILIGGFGAAIDGGIPLLRTGWVLWPIVLFSVSGIVFGLRLAPLQRRIARLAEDEAQTQQTWQAYCGLYRRWEIWGVLAWLTPVLALVIMVLKPALPGI